MRAVSANCPGLPAEITSAAVARPGASDGVRPNPGMLQAIASIPAIVLVGLIRIYQSTISPVLPIITMGRCGCRFAPTCSHYAAEAIRVHGAGRGLMMAIVRLLKCTPLHPGGLDPVPARVGPVCRRSPLSSLTSQPSAH